MSQASYQKRMRERARQEKAALKRERREQRAAEAAAAAEEAEPVAAVPQERVLAQLEDLHKKFDDELIDFDEFEERKAELIAQLSV